MSVRFQHESVVACWTELIPLTLAHWQGTMGYRRHEPFQPLLSRYAAYEQSGMYRLLTARDEVKLVGYFGLYLTDSMHSQKRMVVEDTFFLHPDYRKGRNAIRFIRFAESKAQEWGAKEILFSCESDNAVANALLRYLDYEPVIMMYSKPLHSPNLEPTAPNLIEELSHVRT